MNLLNKIYPDYEISFIIGMDSLCSLAQWYRATELVQKAQFLIYPRPGVQAPSYLELNETFGSRNSNRLLASILPDRFATSTISATEIRKLAHEQNWDAMTQMVAAPVLDLIKNHQLYQ